MKLENINRIKDLIRYREELLEDLKHISFDYLRLNGYDCCSEYIPQIKSAMEKCIKDLIKQVEKEIEKM